MVKKMINKVTIFLTLIIVNLTACNTTPSSVKNTNYYKYELPKNKKTYQYRPRVSVNKNPLLPLYKYQINKNNLYKKYNTPSYRYQTRSNNTRYFTPKNYGNNNQHFYRQRIETALARSRERKRIERERSRQRKINQEKMLANMSPEERQAFRRKQNQQQLNQLRALMALGAMFGGGTSSSSTTNSSSMLNRPMVTNRNGRLVDAP